MSGALLQAASVAVRVNLDGESFGKGGASSPQTATLRVDQDGNVYTHSGQIDSGTDWIRPAQFAPGDYEVRYTNRTGDALTTTTAAEDVWHSLSSGDFLLQLQQTGTGSKSSTFDLEIRLNGTVLATGSYTMTATVTA